MLAHWEKLKAAGETKIPALYQAMDTVLDVQGEKLAITRRIAGDIKDIWSLQPRFESRAGKRPYGLLEHPRFRAGYDFLLLRAESGEIEAGTGRPLEHVSRMPTAKEGRRCCCRNRPATASAGAGGKIPRRQADGSSDDRGSTHEHRLRRPRRQHRRTGGYRACRLHGTRRTAGKPRPAHLVALPHDPGRGLRNQPDFINAAAVLETTLGAEALLDALLDLETRFGRHRRDRNGPRTLDLDLLLYNDSEIDQPRLTVPHPRLHLRAFVLRPLAEIAPDLAIPRRGSVAAWLPAVANQGIVRL